MSDDERVGLISFTAASREAGVSLCVGLLKIRIPPEYGGKSGGCRTIYIFGGLSLPIYLNTVFARNEKHNFTRVEQLSRLN